MTKKNKKRLIITAEVGAGAALAFWLWRLFHGTWGGKYQSGEKGSWLFPGSGNTNKLDVDTFVNTVTQDSPKGTPTDKGANQGNGPGANEGNNPTKPGWTTGKSDGTYYIMPDGNPVNDNGGNASDSVYVYPDGGTPESHGYTWNSTYGFYQNADGVSMDDEDYPDGYSVDLAGNKTWNRNVKNINAAKMVTVKDGKIISGIKQYRWKGVGDASNNLTDFIQAYFAPALKAQKMTGVFPETMFFQAQVESTGKVGDKWVFGQGEAARNANNFFGIHADSSWTGATYDSVDGGQNVAFRKYDDVASSIADYYTYLQSNGYYRDALKMDNPVDQIMNIINVAHYSQTPISRGDVEATVKYIMAAEAQAPKGDQSYTPTSVDVAVDTDKEVEDYNDKGGSQFTEDNSDLTWKDKLELFYIAHETPIKVVGGAALLIGIAAIATGGFKKNPVRRKKAVPSM